MELELNEKEKKMLKNFPKNGEPISIRELAELCFRSVGTASNKRGNSWVRNSLRKPVKHKMVKQVARGLYKLTDKAMTKPAPKRTAKKSTKRNIMEATRKNSAETTSAKAGSEATPALQ